MPKKIKPAGSIKNANSWELTKTCDRLREERGIPEPGEYLVNVLGGYDPTAPESVLHSICRKARNEGRGFTPEESERIQEIVCDDERYYHDPITREEKIAAAKDLMKYTHAQKKSVEVSGHLTATVGVVPVLSDEAIEKFQEKFCADF